MRVINNTVVFMTPIPSVDSAISQVRLQFLLQLRPLDIHKRMRLMMTEKHYLSVPCPGD